MLQRFKSWLENQRSFLFSWYAKDAQETQEPERSLIDLPDPIRQTLVEGIADLPSNPAEQEAITLALNEAFERWRRNPSYANNSIVVLSSPIAAVSRILIESLEDWSKQQQISLNMLPWTARPDDITAIKPKLEHDLETAENIGEEEIEVFVIPNLSWCFLRSLEGLEGIEYLQSLLCNGATNRFWIIGGGQVGWEYLNSVCSIGAYCGETFFLPPIPAEKLEEWFEPILTQLNITYDDPSLEKQILNSDKNNKANYFEHLAEISQGVSTVAVQGFLKSIRYIEPEEEDTEESQIEKIIEQISQLPDSSQENIESDRLVAQIPKLPSLPDLESTDRYLLYSLLLHGDLTMSALSNSLGDSEAEVQARLQILRRQGIVEQNNRILKINPIYYPKLKRELANNNFIINEQ